MFVQNPHFLSSNRVMLHAGPLHMLCSEHECAPDSSEKLMCYLFTDMIAFAEFVENGYFKLKVTYLAKGLFLRFLFPSSTT